MKPTRLDVYAYVLCAVVVLAVDQFSKAAAMRVDSGMVVDARNPSYALGVVDGPAHVLAFGTLVTLVVFVALIGRWALRLGISPVIPALVTGGMLGNVLDRMVLGSVRDFIVTPWAIFNVADVAVAAGIVASMVAFAVRMYQLGPTATTATLLPGRARP